MFYLNLFYVTGITTMASKNLVLSDIDRFTDPRIEISKNWSGNMLSLLTTSSYYNMLIRNTSSKYEG